MSNNPAIVPKLIEEMAKSIETNSEPDPQLYAYFIQDPEEAISLIDYLGAMEEESIYAGPPLYSAAIFYFDICIAQLQAAAESNNKTAYKFIQKIMDYLAEAINRQAQGISFWLPVLNAFYEVHVELNSNLKNAYLNLASAEEEDEEYDEASHLDSIKALIQDLSDLSHFDVAENFFAQSYAMPSEFFADLTIDLFSVEAGHDIALLGLLHPSAEVRSIVIATFEQLIDQIQLSSISLSRLKAIKDWYPVEQQALFDHWIKIQRKKGVVFSQETPATPAALDASEVDGSGSQGIFIHLKNKREHRLAGVLVRYNFGIKDAWITPIIPKSDVSRYYHEAFEESVTLRPIDLGYLQMICEHFLAITIEKGEIPDLHLLEIEEHLGLHLKPNKIDVKATMDELAIQISPFTPDTLKESLSRSALWPKNKQFTESWYEENQQIDKIVNRHCSIVEGVKVCHFEQAFEEVMTEVLEKDRPRWIFHFLWIALWAKNQPAKREKIWQDSFMIAYAIQEGHALKSIPLLVEICRQSVFNSVETMQDRRTYLHTG